MPASGFQAKRTQAHLDAAPAGPPRFMQNANTPADNAAGGFVPRTFRDSSGSLSDCLLLQKFDVYAFFDYASGHNISFLVRQLKHIGMNSWPFLILVR